MAGRDLLGETAENFSYSPQTPTEEENRSTEQSTAKEALIIVITGNTKKLIFRVKQPFETSSNTLHCIAWILFLLLITKSSQKVRKAWHLLVVRDSSDIIRSSFKSSVICAAISGPSRRMFNASLMSGVLNAAEASFSSLF